MPVRPTNIKKLERLTFNFKLSRDELHKFMGGGEVSSSSIILIEGDFSSGKSVVTQRLAYGFLKNGATITYVSTDMTTKEFIRQMFSFNYDIVEYLISRDLLFIPVIPAVGGHATSSGHLRRLMQAGHLFQNDIFILDSLSNFLSPEEQTEKAVFNFIVFLKRVSNLNKMVILTLNPAMVSTDLTSALEGISDIYLELSAEKLMGSIKHKITVKKFKGAARRVTDMIRFRIEPNFGLVVDISALV